MAPMQTTSMSTNRAGHGIDPAFLDLPRAELAAAALEVAAAAGASHADFRLERHRQQSMRFRNKSLESQIDGDNSGFAVRVIVDGTWGFASGVVMTVDEAVRVAREAVEVAKVSRALNAEPIELASEPVHHNAVWISEYDIDPFTIDSAEKAARIGDLCGRLLAADNVQLVDASVLQVRENKFYADLSGTTTTQQRVRLQTQLNAVQILDNGGFENMRTLAEPVGRGWEWMTTGYDWDREIAEIPSLLAEKCAAPSVQSDIYDLVIHPSNLFLTIHESIGHATELDRALGYESAYAGTSFATLDKLGTLKYGSPLMHVTGDRNVEHGLATIGYDDDGVQTQNWDIVRDGTLVGYQLDRRMAAQNGKTLGVERSNGCAFADSPGHIPLQRMANVSLQPDPNGPDTDGLIAGVDRGIYVVGDNSWSIDMQRYNFQFTGQRFYRIENGKLAGQVKDVAYQATTTDFWGSMEAVGGPQTYVLGGAMNCGKAQPGQIAAVSHGCPSALFRNVRVLNTVEEGGR
jgi:TldD protein